MIRKVPLIVILGSTGTGKTKLSLELAERFNGEVISADSMQVYANLDIVTAKATKEEQQKIRHHLLDVASPTEPFTVVNFRNAALPIIDNLLACSKTPIVVGGTNYYIESLLWDILVSPGGENSGPSTAKNAQAPTNANTDQHTIKRIDMAKMSAETLHEHLKSIDPETANKLHPNNIRKIKRGIEYYQETGEKLSDKIKEQRAQPGGNRLGGPLRYPHTILLWLRCNQDVLNSRLDKRVDSMLEQGLLRELRAFHNAYNANKSGGSSITDTTIPGSIYTRGVLQTIGYKEFIPYLEEFNAANDQIIEDYLKLNAYKLQAEDSTSHDDVESMPPGFNVLMKCLSELKLVTKRYSKKQIKWINNRFLASKDRQVPDMYELDTSDVIAWQQNVYDRAVNVIDAWRNGKPCEINPMQKRIHPSSGLEEETSNYCEQCKRFFIGEFQWQLHMKSNKHKKRSESLRKKRKLNVNNE